jgi:homospermidine synthase
MKYIKCIFISNRYLKNGKITLGNIYNVINIDKEKLLIIDDTGKNSKHYMKTIDLCFEDFTQKNRDIKINNILKN